MTDKQTIPVRLAALPRDNPLIWQDEGPSLPGLLPAAPDDALSLLGAPAQRWADPVRLPEDFEPGPDLRRWLDALVQALSRAAQTGADQPALDLAPLSSESRLAVCEILGEGEVTGEVTLDGRRWCIVESAMTGIWRLTSDDGAGRVEIARVPSVVEQAAAALRPAPVSIPLDAPDLMNGAAILSEINARAAAYDGGPNHVINFSLMPISEGDQKLLTSVLGRASLSLTSGGFGLCEIMATTVRHVWAVQFRSAMNHTILDTIEVGGVPSAARATVEDFEDSAQRLSEILEAYL